MSHCWAMDRILFVTQYSTSPDGKNAKNTVKTKGRAFITFYCIGSIGAGFSFCCINMVAPMTMGRT